jgi:hypothetical protein
MIFAHIAGLSEHLKNNLIKTFTSSNYIFEDLDKLTDKIMQDKNMVLLIQKYEYYCEKSKSLGISKLQAKQFIVKSKDIERKMTVYWKNKINYYIIETVNSTPPSKKIILLGYCNFFKNIRIFINIQTNIKFFYSINNDPDFIKNIVKTNLDTHREEIINGTFNLDLLNPSLLTKKREITSNLYIKNGYDLKTFDSITQFFNISLQNYDVPQVLFFASKTDYNKKINLSKIIAYSDDWIAIVSGIKSKSIIKGYELDDPNKPFVQEIEKGGLEQLNDSINLYVITNTLLFTPVITKNYLYKYETNKPVQIHNKIFVNNIRQKLKEIGIKQIGLKKK